MSTELGSLDIKLTASGLDAVLDAFKTVEARLQSLNKLSKAAQSIALAEARARLEVAKAATLEAKAKAAAAKTAAREEDAERKASVKATKEAEREKTRTVETETRARIRETKKAADAEEREIKRIAASRKRIAGQLAGSITGAVGSTLGLAGRVLGAGLALGGGFSLGDAFQREHQMARQATQIEVQSRGDFTKQDAIAQARSIGSALNIDENDYLTGSYQFLLNTGKGQMTKDVMPELAHLAKAEGVDISELGRAAGMMAHQNKNMTGREVTEFMRIVVGQGKSELGSVSLEEMTRVFSEATSKAGFYRGNQGDNQVKLASLVQVAKATTRGVEEAGTAAQHVTTDIIKHQKDFGFRVTDDSGKLNDVNYIIAHAIASTGGNVTKLSKMFGERSIAVPAALLPTYNEAEAKQKGSGEAAVMNQLTQINRERITSAEEARDLAQQQADQFEQVDKAMRDLERAVGVGLVPVLVSDLIPAIRDATPAFVRLLKGVVDLVSWAEHHPWEAAFAGLGLRIGSAVVGEVVKANIAGLITKLLTPLGAATAAPGATAATAAAGGAATAGGVSLAGALGFAALAGGAIYSAGSEAVDEWDAVFGPAPETQAERTKRLLATGDQQGLINDIMSSQRVIDSFKPGPDGKLDAHAQEMIAKQKLIIDVEQAKLRELGAAMGESFVETVSGSKFDFMRDNGGGIATLTAEPDPGPRGARGSNLSGK